MYFLGTKSFDRIPGDCGGSNPPFWIWHPLTQKNYQFFGSKNILKIIIIFDFTGSEATPPVEFSTTPPNHVHKPRRSTSPPPCIKDTRSPSEEPHLEFRPLDDRKERRAISSKRRYRQSRIHHIQRPCLDFEKMQLVRMTLFEAWLHMPSLLWSNKAEKQ